MVGIPSPNRGDARGDSPLQLSPLFQGRAGAGTGGFPWHKLFITQAALPSQVFKPVWSLGEHWFCSALGGPGWTVSPQKAAGEGCRYYMLPDGCWASQHPALPYPRSLCSCPWLRCRRNTRCFPLVPWHACTTILALGARWVQLSGCPSR